MNFSSWLLWSIVSTVVLTSVLAGSQGIVLHELSTQTGSLEDAFLKATASVQEYQAGAL